MTQQVRWMLDRIRLQQELPPVDEALREAVAYVIAGNGPAVTECSEHAELEEYRGIAALCWTHKALSGTRLDPTLAEVFAGVLYAVANTTREQVEQEARDDTRP